MALFAEPTLTIHKQEKSGEPLGACEIAAPLLPSTVRDDCAQHNPQPPAVFGMRPIIQDLPCHGLMAQAKESETSTVERPKFPCILHGNSAFVAHLQPFFKPTVTRQLLCGSHRWITWSAFSPTSKSRRREPKRSRSLMSGGRALGTACKSPGGG